MLTYLTNAKFDMGNVSISKLSLNLQFIVFMNRTSALV